MALPVNKCIVQRIDSEATGFATMVFKIRETTSEHNVVYELLKALHHDHPGVWWQFQQALKTEREAIEEKVKPVLKEIVPTPTNDERLLEEN